MTLNDYQVRTKETKKRGMGPLYSAVALAGEVGEVCNEIKKHVRDDKGTMTEERLDKIILELGDVLWYLASLADDFGVTLEYVAAANLSKLEARYLSKKRAGHGVIQ